MDSNILLTCNVSNGLYISSCRLIRTSSVKHEIEVMDDPLAVFEGFEYESSPFNDMKPQKAIVMFKEMCLDAYTCHGSFSIEEVRQNGEENEFRTE